MYQIINHHELIQREHVPTFMQSCHIQTSFHMMAVQSNSKHTYLRLNAYFLGSMGGGRMNPEKSGFCLPTPSPNLEGHDPRFFKPETGSKGRERGHCPGCEGQGSMG